MCDHVVVVPASTKWIRTRCPTVADYLSGGRNVCYGHAVIRHDRLGIKFREIPVGSSK